MCIIEKMKGKKTRQCCENLMRMYVIQFKIRIVWIVFQWIILKATCFVDECNERGDSIDQRYTKLVL